MNTDDQELSIGDKVTKGHFVYTVTAEPKDGIFRGSNDKGEVVTLSVREIRMAPVGPTPC